MLDTLHAFARRGVELHVVGRGKVEAATASGFLVTSIEGVVSEHFRRVVSEKTAPRSRSSACNGAVRVASHPMATTTDRTAA